ncbi:hypothetical protein ACHAXM_000779 [Skeletonema potamos]|jgi:hypothetical protein
MNTPQDDVVVIERLRLKIPNAHIFKLPPKPSAGGWRGAEWRDKIWQGTLKVVERNDDTAVLLVDAQNEKNIFAMCPISHQLDDKSNNGGNGVDRCIDSSRYFVLRIQNSQGRHMFIGLAFNERNDAFDFNTALEDSRREKMAEKKAAAAAPLTKKSIYKNGNSVDYKMKEGEKIKVSIGNTSGSGSNYHSGGGAAAKRRLGKTRPINTGSGGFLKPSTKDTPSRLA